MDYPSCVLVVVDVQRYYLDPSASFYRWTKSKSPRALEYITRRVRSDLIPAVLQLEAAFRARDWPIAYLRLCGTAPDRSDLHRFFREACRRAASEGYPDLYPLCSEPLSDVIPELAPEPGDAVLDKTTFSGFASGGFSEWLRKTGRRVLVLSGLATSQCVDTTARDASDRGYAVVHVEDAQADYGSEEHYASLLASRGVCGGTILSSGEFCADPEAVLASLAKREAL